MRRLAALLLALALLLTGCTPKVSPLPEKTPEGAQDSADTAPAQRPDGSPLPDRDPDAAAPDEKKPAGPSDPAGADEKPGGEAVSGPEAPADNTGGQDTAKPDGEENTLSGGASGPDSGQKPGGQEPADANGPGGGQRPQSPEPPAGGQEGPVQPDGKGMMDLGGNFVLKPEELDLDSVDRFAAKIQSVKDSYLSGAASVQYAIIPDKSYYAQGQAAFWLDHDQLMARLRPQLSGWDEIDLAGLLKLDDFLKTDNHWRQERLIPVAQAVAGQLGFSVSEADFTSHTVSGFLGSYRSFAEDLPPEEILYLTSPWTQAASCDNFQYPDRTAVYDESLVDSLSAYDLFLGGQTPLLTVTVPNSSAQGHLVVFRDSFGASLTPLLLSGYSKVTLVDLRYMAAELLPQFVDADGADVLFLFCDRVVNNSALLK